ncbi:MAG: hypothetical protein LBB50_02005, partial [Oscillospiraceae bacterium]|nr:hypothetical protein [Oscillospiraceae bacterium]
MKLAFSSLGCPEYAWADMTALAKDTGFHGIELRGFEDTPTQTLVNALQKLKTGRLEISCVSTGSSLQYPATREQSLTDAR